MAASDVLVSPAYIWYAPVGEALPSADTVGAGVVWGGNWKNLGYTLEPVSVNLDVQTFKLYVQQLLAPLRITRTQQELAFESVLAEMTGQNLGLAFDGTVVTTAAAPTIAAKDTVTVKGDKVDVSVYAVGIEGIRVTDANVRVPIRFFLPRASITLNGPLAFAKDAGAGIPVHIDGLVDNTGNQLIIHNVTAPKTA
jgi:hypothetical protein